MDNATDMTATEPDRRPRGLPAWFGPLLAAVVAVGAALAASQGGWLGAAAAVGAMAGGLLLGRGVRGEAPPATEDTGGARLMAREIVPVWQRHLEASHGEVEKGIGALLQSFSSLSDGLAAAAAQTAAGGPVNLGVGATDELIDRSGTTLDELIGPMQALRHQRFAMLRELGQLDDMVGKLRRHAKDLRVLARHSSLVALNASIEANRAGQAQGGFGVVAREVRDLSARATATGEALGAELDAAALRVTDLRRSTELADRSDEELQVEARLRARRVVGSLLSEMGQALQASGELREISMQLRDDLEKIFMGFQFQDRLSQMLDALRNDMARFSGWAASDGTASAADVRRWLEDLERSYTMEEQRTQHHDTVQIERQASVEFF